MLIRAFLFLVLSSASSFAQTITEAHRGAWIGEGLQDGETWAMELHIVPGGARVDYPDFPCGGSWVLRRDGQDAAEGTEWLTYGLQDCWDGLTVRITSQGDGRLFIGWHDKETEVATARLSRVGSKSKSGGGKKN